MLALKTKGCVLYSAKEQGAPLIAAYGIEDLVVTALPDAVLVCRRQDAQRVKEIVKALQESDREQLT